jgi:hypothetical protein
MGDSVKDGTTYYKLLAEFSLLRRHEMRGFKKLLVWCLDKAGGSKHETPLRMKSLQGTGFVVIPVPSTGFGKRLTALENFGKLRGRCKI